MSEKEAERKPDHELAKVKHPDLLKCQYFEVKQVSQFENMPERKTALVNMEKTCCTKSHEQRLWVDVGPSGEPEEVMCEVPDKWCNTTVQVLFPFAPDPNKTMAENEEAMKAAARLALLEAAGAL